MLKTLRELVSKTRAQSAKLQQLGLGSFVFALGGVAALSPFLSPASSGHLVGGLLIAGGSAEVLHSFRLASPEASRGAYTSGIITVVMGALVQAAHFLVSSGLAVLIGLSYLVDGLQLAWTWFRTRQKAVLMLALFNLALGVGLITIRFSAILTLALVGGIRLVSVALDMLAQPVLDEADAGQTLKADLRLPDLPEVDELCEEATLYETGSRPYDRGWILAFLATLFAIHVGRMQTDWTLVALSAPFVAVLGDCFVALVVSFGILVPLHSAFQRLGRGVEPRIWAYAYAAGERRHRAVRGLLAWRLRLAVRIRQSRYSLSTALERALGMGLPVSAVLTATVPIWGMNWYFDTENWASGMHDSWAAHRTVAWREAMVRASSAGAQDPFGPEGFELEKDLPDGDFSFLVTGDTGEGDPSQLVLSDQLVLAGLKPEVKFLVLSSDVVYPSGAMVGYETRFFLPFKGFNKPIYAIPGNHDWYDALEGFTAVFFQEGAARKAMRARVEADQNLTTTTDDRIESLLGQASRLRKLYGIKSGYQTAPYFQIQTDDFVLIACDTGVLRRLDTDQRRWLEASLDRAGDKFKMVILGHPFYAGGRDLAEGDEDFSELRNLLKRHEVKIVMAGDTHDFEYYREDNDTHHFVNGGGGAYLSFGTALSWPTPAALPAWAFYPSIRDVTGKIQELTPAWKRPLWWWTLYADAWPFSAEWLSAAFDYNVAPFYQSFVEVQVRRSDKTVRIVPWGVHGPLDWSELERSSDLPQSGPVEFVFPLL